MVLGEVPLKQLQKIAVIKICTNDSYAGGHNFPGFFMKKELGPLNFLV